MPGSPYLEEPPSGLVTWPKILMIGVPSVSAISLVAWWQDILLEWGVFLTIGLTISFLMRR